MLKWYIEMVIARISFGIENHKDLSVKRFLKL
jgi:hypothetical protein